MHWSYKTVQYGLKKEGLLGSAFLDEVEVEQSLNEFGQAGWELVSIFPMHDGLMAVFRQGFEQQHIVPPELKAEPEIPDAVKKTTVEQEFDVETVEVPRRFSLRPQSVEPIPPTRKIGQREPVMVEREEQGATHDDGIGGIRIE